MRAGRSSFRPCECGAIIADMDKKIALPASAMLLAALASPAEARPLASLCEGMEPFRKISDLKYVKPVIRVKSKSETVGPGDMTFTIEAKSGPIKFAPSADGRIDLPLTDALCAENPNMISNQPEGTVVFSVSIDPQIPPAKSLDYRQLDELRREWNEAVSRQRLAWRMLAPSPKAFQLAFEAGRAASAEIRLPQGIRKLVADAKGDLVIPFDSTWADANPAIVLSEIPKRIGLRFKD
jgi:hypothetical protein